MVPSRPDGIVSDSAFSSPPEVNIPSGRIEGRRQNTEYRIQNTEWRMENGEWRMEKGEWRKGNGPAL
jgi:hypothetical protein